MKGRSRETAQSLAERILASHQEPSASGKRIWKVDQWIASVHPGELLASALASGVTSSAVETAVVYPPYCIARTETDAKSAASAATSAAANGGGASRCHVGRVGVDGVLVAQPGVGFAPAVHLERFASPARLAIVDDPRLCTLGALGMLTLPVSDAALASALGSGYVELPEPTSVLVQVTGRPRPFVSVRDAALDLLRSGAAEAVAEARQRHRAPVVLEFGGPGARQLSVPERAILASIAPRLGAWTALFPSDDKVEAFLRDQRRSKAYRALVGEAVDANPALPLDLSLVDPLIYKAPGEVLSVRLLEGKPVSQVLLGGDSGISLRDLYTVSTLLKGKRLPGSLEFLLCPPSRQSLEVMARDGVLFELMTIGARLVEPDRRVLRGEYYPPSGDGLSLANVDPMPDALWEDARLVASAETLAFALAHGQLGDPRGFRRQVRVTLPRQLPTEDTLLLGDTRRDGTPRRSARAPDIEA